MTRAARQPFVEEIEAIRGRRLITLMNFDRASIPKVPGLTTHFDSSVKEPLFRVLKETVAQGDSVDLFLYTRGGDVNAVWPIVSLLREFDPDFEVLVPFRCHSSGSLVTLGARRVVMGRLAELSPFDPTTGNAFNPKEEGAANNSRLGISVEDVQAYREFVLQQLDLDPDADANWREHASSLIAELVSEVHPLALGNVYRVHRQIQTLADRLLTLSKPEGEDGDHEATIVALTTEFYSHQHMINRHEAAEILGDRVVHASTELDEAMDALMGQYKEDFELWQPYCAHEKMGQEPEVHQRFFGGLVESTDWSYAYETNVRIRQFSQFPEGVKLQVSPNKALPLFPGLPRRFMCELISQRWIGNEEPKGVDK